MKYCCKESNIVYHTVMMNTKNKDKYRRKDSDTRQRRDIISASSMHHGCIMSASSMSNRIILGFHFFHLIIIKAQFSILSSWEPVKNLGFLLSFHHFLLHKRSLSSWAVQLKMVFQRDFKTFKTKVNFTFSSTLHHINNCFGRTQPTNIYPSLHATPRLQKKS